MAFVKNIVQALRKRCFHHHKPASATFGIMFDIDGVIMRGARVLPQAQRAFKLLTDENGFRVPTVILIFPILATAIFKIQCRNTVLTSYLVTLHF